MLDLIGYWLVYGILVIGLLAVPLYFLTDIIDLLIKDLTKGDVDKYVRRNYKIPFMKRLGFKFDSGGGFNIGCLRSFLIFLSCVISTVILCWVCLVAFLSKGIYPYEVFHYITSFMLPCAWIIYTVGGYFIVRKSLQNLYQLIKKVNKLVDKD